MKHLAATAFALTLTACGSGILLNSDFVQQGPGPGHLRLPLVYGEYHISASSSLTPAGNPMSNNPVFPLAPGITISSASLGAMSDPGNTSDQLFSDASTAGYYMVVTLYFVLPNSDLTPYTHIHADIQAAGGKVISAATAVDTATSSGFSAAIFDSQSLAYFPQMAGTPNGFMAGLATGSPVGISPGNVAVTATGGPSGKMIAVRLISNDGAAPTSVGSALQIRTIAVYLDFPPQ
jgi:hypothetical protein